MTPFFQSNWPYLLLNYALAALFWTFIARFVMSFFTRPDSTNFVWLFFRRLTDPLLLRARNSQQHGRGWIALAIALTFAARVGLFWAFRQAGLV